MRHFDFTPLHRSTIGFDRLFSMLDSANAETPSYPPYNIERTDENNYRITMAVAGFGEADLSLEAKEHVLTIKGEKKDEDENRDILYRGIASRAFERRFQLAEHVQVAGASLVNGLLNVELKREIPESAKPRKISISGEKAENVKILKDADAA